MTLLNLSDNWKDDTEILSLLNKTGPGQFTENVSDAVLEKNLSNLEGEIANLLDRALSIEDLVTNRASGGEGGPIARNFRSYIGLMEEMGPVEELLSDEGKEILNQKKDEFKNILIGVGGLSEIEANKEIESAINRKGIASSIQKNIEQNFTEEAGKRLRLLGLEANIRNGRPLNETDKRTLKEYGLSEGASLEEIQNIMAQTKGLEDAKQASIDVTKRQEEAAKPKFNLGGIPTVGTIPATGYEGNYPSESDLTTKSRFSNVEDIAAATGIDINRIQQLKDNMQKFIKDTGLTGEDARQWALIDKGPTHDEFFAINMLANTMGAEVPMEGTPEEQELRKSQGLDIPDFTSTPEKSVTETVTEGVATPTEGATTDTTTTGETVTEGVTTAETQAAMTPDQKLAEALAYIDQSDLDPDTKALYKQVVRNWDLNQELNMDNVLTEFKKIQETTIDPFFAEKINQYTTDLEIQKNQLEQQRALEKEEEASIFGERERAAKAALEARGMTFTGEGVRQLGEKSAFARAGTEEATQASTPLQTPFGGTYEEGLIPKSARIAATSSLARYRAGLESLGRQAESALGTTQAQQLLPGQFTPTTGGVAKGTIQLSKEEQLGQILSDIAGQQRQNISYQQPLT